MEKLRNIHCGSYRDGGLFFAVFLFVLTFSVPVLAADRTLLRNPTQSCLSHLDAAIEAQLARVPSDKIASTPSGDERRASIARVVQQSGNNKKVRVSYDPELDTIVRHSPASRGERVRAGAPDFRPIFMSKGEEKFVGENPLPSEVWMPMFAGAGGRSSHSGSDEVAVEVFTAPHTLDRPSKGRAAFSAELRDLPSYRRVAAEAVDLYGHLHGPEMVDEVGERRSLDDAIQLLFDYFESLKAMSDIPIIPRARSASAGLLLEFNYRFPGYLDGLILVGPLYPGTGFQESTMSLLNRVSSDPRAELQIDAFQLYRSFYGEMQFQESDRPLGELPVLVLRGNRDHQTSEAVVREFQQEMQRQDHELSRARSLDGDHALFGGDKPMTAKPTFIEVYDFIDDVLRARQT